MQDVGQGGRTVLFVSHNMPAVTRLCQRGLLIENGQVKDDGPAGDVVGRYLTSELGTSAAREWNDSQDAPAGNAVRLIAVRVRNTEGNVSENIDISQTFSIEMEYEAFDSGHVLQPHFHLINDQGIKVFVTIDNDDAWRGKKRSAGVYLSRVYVPGNLLAEGMYVITCSLLTKDPDVLQFSERTAVSFNVSDNFEGNTARGDFSRKIPGVVRPYLDWETVEV